MSTTAIDTARTSERLSAFLSRIEHSMPVDNIFEEIPFWDAMWKKKKMIDGGRQQQIPVDTAQNTTIQSFSGYDTFSTVPQDTARTAVFAYVNKGGTVSISWEEMRETANDDVRVFDLVAHKRNNAAASMRDALNVDAFAAAPGAKDINSLPFLITTTGTVGGINSATATWWRSQEQTAVGAFTTNGLTAMRALWNSIRRQGHGNPDVLLTTQTVYEAYEAELDVDVRYADASKLGRGAESLSFHKQPLFFDADMTAGEMYFLNTKHISLKVDTDGDMKFGEFQEPTDQMVFTSKFAFRGQLIIDARRAHGRLTGIS